MTKILLTAFDRYGPWQENASWLALVALLGDLASHVPLTTRRYPVDFSATEALLRQDLASGHDVVLHLGQAPGAGVIRLEQIAINVAGDLGQMPHEFQPLIPGGPLAYRSQLPLNDWIATLAAEDIPAEVSYHAGTYLCNAAMYWSHWYLQQQQVTPRVGFIHLPLTPQQAEESGQDCPSLSSQVAAQALRLILDGLVRQDQQQLGLA